MTCYSPLQGWKSAQLTANGKRSIVFNPKDALGQGRMFHMEVACGQCIGCRLEYSRQWAIRCMHEASLHAENSFITLTYNNKFVPKYGALNYTHWTNFMKRLRRRFPDKKIRFYMGPEYGEDTHRPHYHALLFGIQFPDLELISIRNDNRLYRSRILDSLWSCPKRREPYGFASVGYVTFQSAAYVARYMMKKVKGEDHLMRYFSKDIDFDSGECFPIPSERARMSLRPGLAKDWYERYKDDVVNNDFVVMNGKKVRPPRYYDSLLQKMDPAALDAIKQQRVIDAHKHQADRTPERLATRLKCQAEKLSRLPRRLINFFSDI